MKEGTKPMRAFDDVLLYNYNYSDDLVLAFFVLRFCSKCIIEYYKYLSIIWQNNHARSV